MIRRPPAARLLPLLALAALSELALPLAAAQTFRWPTSLKEIVERVIANYARMRARGITIVTELSPEYERGLRTAGQVAVDEWLARMGPAGKDILDRYRARLATSPAGGTPSAGGTR